MGQLSRKKARPLLKQVGHKPHASSDDHHEDGPRRREGRSRNMQKGEKSAAEKSIVTPPGTNSSFGGSSQRAKLEEGEEEDVYADPVSSGEEMGVVKSMRKSMDRTSRKSIGSESGFRSVDVGCERPVRKPEFKVADAGDVNSKTKGSLGSAEKRKFQQLDIDAVLDAEPEWIQSAPSKKKQERSGPAKNIHAPPIKPRGFVGYGKVADKTRERDERKKSSQKKASSPKNKKRAVFKVLDVGVDYDTGAKASPFAVAGAGDDDAVYAQLGSSSPMSSARSTPGPDGVHGQGVLDPKPMIECGICGEHVDKFLQEEFEDVHNIVGNVEFKWKRRFCDFHKQQEAKVLWEQRSYPDIRWSTLEGRMRIHHDYLVDVLCDRKPSHYRDRLKEKVKPGTKGVRQVFDAMMDVGKNGEKRNSKPQASVGYYGSMGARIMTDHIITHLADDIRQRAKRDKLVAASGVQGGISGFVQAVLVPHLAELLIREDMELTGEWHLRAREIMAESGEVGEILHPEVEDRVVEVSDDSDDDEHG